MFNKLREIYIKILKFHLTLPCIIQQKWRHIPEDLNLNKQIYEKLLKTISSNMSVSSKIKGSARFEVLRVALVKMQLFWDSTLCRLVNTRDSQMKT